ncbi:MAG TPA: carbohydrate ABC transporter permease [Clostridia bacterium]|nr:carbohydrate ABC transporter permease [Clostridia bacterium]
MNRSLATQSPNASARHKRKRNVALFPLVNGLVFVLFCLFILLPLWKVLIDSLDLTTGYGMKLWPERFGFEGYTSVFTNKSLYVPLLNSVVTTLSGTLLGLLLSTLGAYVLIQFDMPGRTFFAGILLFTMIFRGGMIPTYIVMKNFGLVNTLWAVILYPAIDIYNLVLMRNFFEGIPNSLLESATLDGCTPMQVFYKIVLPLSKAALASIGLMFAVLYWNDYTNYKLYITKETLYNFQMKLRSIMMGSDLPSANNGATENTVQNAAVIIAILPFLILYPFLQRYFVTGINIGAVKG